MEKHLFPRVEGEGVGLLCKNSSELRVLILICLAGVPQIDSLLQIHPNVRRSLEHSR